MIPPMSRSVRLRSLWAGRPDGSTNASMPAVRSTSARGAVSRRSPSPRRKPRLARHGAVSAAVEIGRNVTVAPVPVAGDPKPQSPRRSRSLPDRCGNWRPARLEQGLVGNRARLTERLINALPAQDQETADVRSALWDKALTTVSADPEAMALARRAFDGCQSALANGYTRNMRHCLELQHGAF